jgi:multiple sugar transport system substrate-binding protein
MNDKNKYVLLFLLVYFFFSCGNNNGKKNSLTYWSSNNSYEILFAKKVTDKWNIENPDFKISFQPVPEGQSSEEVILAAVVGETTPDLYSNMWQGDVEAYAQANVLVALDTLDGFLDFIYTRCDSTVIEEITSLDGHIYQIPWKINPIMLIYNEALINSIGLNKPPKTYQEFFEACEKFKSDTDGDGYTDRWFGYAEVQVTWWQRFFDFYPLYLAASNGAPLVKDSKSNFNNDAAVKVFSFLRELYKREYFSTERLSARQDVFLSSVIATRFTGPWEIMHADNFKPKGFEYNFAPMPVPDDFHGQAFTYGDPKNIVIFNTCSNPQKAWKFLKSILNEEIELELLKITNQIPRRKDLLTNTIFSEYFKNNPKMKTFAEQARFVKGTDASPYLKEVFDLISQEYEACVVYGIKTPEEAIQDASDAVDLLYLK